MPRSPEVRAGGFTRNDGAIEFYSRVHALLPVDGTVVDFGAGRGTAVTDDGSAYRRSLRDLRSDTRRVIGLDIDDAVLHNPSLDEARVIGESEPFPIANHSVDVIVASMVFEHLRQPHWAVAEIDRVLRPGGWICARTPNRHGYIGVGARLVPNRFHASVLRRLQPDRHPGDVFPTAYRLNTLRDLKSFFPTSRFVHCTYPQHPDPPYFGRSSVALTGFNLLQRLTPDRWAPMLMVFIQKEPR